MASILSLFDGMACGYIAFKELGIPISEYHAYEIDKYANLASSHNFPDIIHHGDVFVADFGKHKGVEWLIGGSPCFTKGHLVCTDKGYKDISRIEVGDMVLTHKNRFKPVKTLYVRKAPIVDVKVAGYKVIHTTANHPFYTYRNPVFQPNRSPQWVSAENLKTWDYCGRHADKCDNAWATMAVLDVGADTPDELETIIEYDNIVWTRVQFVKPTDRVEMVYNIEVEDDHSYTVNDLIVKNCTYWSIAQSKNREVVASGMGWDLFCQYVRALREAEPKYFLYENNKSMSQAIRESITNAFGFEPICINSALVSAQNRQRLYWVGVRQEDGTYRKADIDQPEDRHIFLRDILECGYGVPPDKSYAVTTRVHGACVHDTLKRHRHSMCAEPLCVASRGRYLPEGGTAQHLEVRGQRTNAITTVSKDNYISEPVACRQVGRRLNDDGHRNDYNKEIPCIQRYEVNDNPSRTNTLSTVTKDNLVGEPVHTTVDGKARCIRASCWRDGQRNLLNERDVRTGVAEACCISRPHGYFQGRMGNTLPTLTSTGSYQQNHKIAEPIPHCDKFSYYPSLSVLDMLRNGEVLPCFNKPVRVGEFDSGGQGNRIYSKDGKAVSMMANGGGRGAKTGLYALPMLKYADVVEWGSEGEPLKARSYADGKVYPVYKVENGIIKVGDREQSIKLADGYWLIRKLTVRECARAQTVPEWYQFPVSDSRAYQLIGNGWTVEVIKHLIQSVLTNDR